MVLEALSKYALGYEKGGGSIRDGGRLRLSRNRMSGKLEIQLP